MAEPTQPDLHAVLLAGGRGERFWPVSTRRRPKPFARELFGTSLMRMTLDRVRYRLPPERVWLVLGREHVDLLYQEAPEVRPDRLLVEPFGRDTSAAIALAAFALERTAGSDTPMLVLPCDHLVQPVEQFWAAVDTALELLAAHPDHLLVFGIPPTRPETGYGYIEIVPESVSGQHGWAPVRAFREKPAAEVAATYVRSGVHFWNSGMFLWRVGRILDLIRQWLPEHYQALAQAFDAWPSDRFAAELEAAYHRMQPISIDYGVMEKAQPLTMVRAEFQWDDVGQWEALDRVLEPGAEQNRFVGPVVALDTRNATVLNTGRKIALLGVEDLIVVCDRDRVLIMKKGLGNALKKLVAQLPEEWTES